MTTTPSSRAKTSVNSDKLWRPRSWASHPRPDSALWLDKNENLDPELLTLTKKVLHSLDTSAIYTYPELGPLYRKLAEWVGVDPSSLVLTAGSDGAIRAVFDLFVVPGDSVIHTSPTFAMYPVYTQMYGATGVELVYERSDEGPKLPVEKVLSVLTTHRAKLLCLPNPDSPTGSVFSRDELVSILATAHSTHTIVLIDEAYHPFYPDSLIQSIPDFPHLIIARTFSKAWGLAGARVGYTVSSSEIAELINKVRPMYEIGALSAAFVEKMLDHASAMEASVQRVNEGKLSFQNAMKELNFKTFPSHGNFMHVAFGHHAPSVHEELKGKVLYRVDFKEECLAGFSSIFSGAQSYTRASGREYCKECAVNVVSRKEI